MGEASERVVSTEGRFVWIRRVPTIRAPWRRARLSRERRREQILKSAELLFAATGLRSTTTSALAKAAGISEAILYRHFGAKQKLFEKVVERNTQERLAGLEGRLSSIPNLPPLECIDRMAEATVLACADGEGNASVMAWALLETPEFAADVYRGEIGATELMWDSEIRNRFAESPVRTPLLRSTWCHMWCMPAWRSGCGLLPCGTKLQRLRHTRGSTRKGSWMPPGWFSVSVRNRLGQPPPGCRPKTEFAGRVD